MKSSLQLFITNLFKLYWQWLHLRAVQSLASMLKVPSFMDR